MITSDPKDDGGICWTSRPVMSVAPSGKTLHDEAIELLRWALMRQPLGVFNAGGSRTEEFWACRGCEAEYIQTEFRTPEYDASTFPHEPDCKYVRACKLIGIKPS